jgi:hypothetical protein
MLKIGKICACFPVRASLVDIIVCCLMVQLLCTSFINLFCINYILWQFNVMKYSDFTIIVKDLLLFCTFCCYTSMIDCTAFCVLRRNCWLTGLKCGVSA